MFKIEAFRRIEICVRAARHSARAIKVDPDYAERNVRGDVYVEETKSGVFRVRVWKHRIRARATLHGFSTDEANRAIEQYERFFNE